MRRLFLSILGISLSLCFADVINRGQPLRGEWNLRLEKVWEVDRAGSDVFLGPDRLQAADDGTLYVHDEMNRVNYIFDQDGRFVRSFGKRGQGPGEIQDQKSFFLVGQTLILVDTAKLHYFSKDADYLKSENNYCYRRRPVAFINDRQFIAAPLGIFEALDGKGSVSLVDLESGKETVLTEFAIFQGAIGRSGGLVGSLIVEGLTPLMIVGFCENKVYYGMSDVYTIHIADLNGKRAGKFSLQRDKKKISAEGKALRFEEFPAMRADARKQIMDTTPNETTFFSRIESHNGLTYVFEPVVNRRNSQSVDIFSPEGRYLYRTTIVVDEGLTMMPQQSANPLLTADHLYVALTDKDSKVRIRKYKISLPLPSGENTYTASHLGDYMGPLDRYQGDMAYLLKKAAKTDLAFIGKFQQAESLKPKVVFPIHAYDREHMYGAFARQAAEKKLPSRVILPENKGDRFKLFTR